MEMSNKLPEDFKAMWIAALRSGEYKQGKAYLYSPTDDSFCCLGVAGLLCGVDRISMVGRSYFDSIEPVETRLPPPESYPVLLDFKSSSNEVVRGLARMNDEGKSFNEIAAYIEANL